MEEFSKKRCKRDLHDLVPGKHQCMPCKRVGLKDWQKRNPDYHTRRSYGVTQDQYNKAFTSQNGVCAICCKHQSILNSKLNVDHCHSSGAFRGLLCGDCNRALGLFKDNIKSLEAAIVYLNLSKIRLVK